MYTGAASRAPRPRRVATPTRAPIPRSPATTTDCIHDRSTAIPRSRAEGIQPSANVAQSFGNARYETERPSHSQETRKHSGRHNPTRTPRTDGRRADRHAVRLSTGDPGHNRPEARPAAPESRHDRRAQNRPIRPARESARPRDRLKRASGPPPPKSSMCEAVRFCVFPPSLTKTTTGERCRSRTDRQPTNPAKPSRQRVRRAGVVGVVNCQRQLGTHTFRCVPVVDKLTDNSCPRFVNQKSG